MFETSKDFIAPLSTWLGVFLLSEKTIKEEQMISWGYSGIGGNGLTGRFYIDKKMFGASQIFLLIAIIISVIIMSDATRPEYYQNLWWLPLGFGLVVVCFSYIFPQSWSNLNFILIVGIFSVRCIITPFCMVLGNYAGFFAQLSQENVNKGILLILFETVSVITYSSYLSIRSNYVSREEVIYLEDNHIKNLFFICLLFLIGTRIAIPEFYSGFTTIFNTDEIRTTVALESTAGPLYTLFSITLPIAFLYVAVYLLNKINGIVKTTIIKSILNIIVCIIPLMFMNNGDGFTMICVISLAITAFQADGFKKGFFVILLGGAVFGITLMLFSLMAVGTNDSGYEVLSKNFQAYFSGICNFAGFFNIGNHDKLRSLFYDIYFIIPFRNSIIGIPGDFRLVMDYTADNNARSQIIPCFAQLYYYFKVFAVFFECQFIRMAFKNYDYLKAKRTMFSKFAYTMIWLYLIFTPVMYNFTIFMTRFIVTLLPLKLIFGHMEKKYSFEEENS